MFWEGGPGYFEVGHAQALAPVQTSGQSVPSGGRRQLRGGSQSERNDPQQLGNGGSVAHRRPSIPVAHGHTAARYLAFDGLISTNTG